MCILQKDGSETGNSIDGRSARYSLGTIYPTTCAYFGPIIVNIGRNKTAKHYDILFTCLNTRAVHLELAIEFLQVLHRFFSIHGTPAVIISDNGRKRVEGNDQRLEVG